METNDGLLEGGKGEKRGDGEGGESKVRERDEWRRDRGKVAE